MSTKDPSTIPLGETEEEYAEAVTKAYQASKADLEVFWRNSTRARNIYEEARKDYVVLEKMHKSLKNEEDVLKRDGRRSKIKEDDIKGQLQFLESQSFKINNRIEELRNKLSGSQTRTYSKKRKK